MTNDYISRQAAIDACFDGWNNSANDCARNIINLPAADVVPVVHGKWLKEDRGHVEYDAVCSVCGFDWMWSDRGYFNFCPNCGAKMDAQRGE